MKIKRLIGGPLESNGYIIYHREKDICYIVDPGYDPGVILAYLNRWKCS